MQHASLMLRARLPGLVSLVLCALLWAIATSPVQAQSGRRIPKRPSSPGPKPPAQTEPPIQPSTPTETSPRIPILVVKYLPNIGSSSIFTTIALEGCLEELRQSAAVQVTSGRDRNRKEASDYAKASADAYVVLIQLEPDVIDSERVSLSGVNPRYLYLSYVVFTPGTGKVKTQGRIYQGQRRGPVGVPIPDSTASAEYELRSCGREAAHRVLDALNLARPQRGATKSGT